MKLQQQLQLKPGLLGLLPSLFIELGLVMFVMSTPTLN